MSEAGHVERPWYKRKRYIVDSRLQFAFALPMLAIVLTVALAYLAAIHVIPGEAARETMTAAETRTVLLRANVFYYAFTAVAVVCVALFVSHRIAGPAFVIERAVRAMGRGDFDDRLSLRPSDYLKSLASAVTELREQIRLEDQERRRLIAELAERLDANDIASAKQLLNDLATGAGAASSAPARAARRDGFTLIELMITV